jgi:hypothetical protein
MNIKTHLRAGSGGASGAGKNGGNNSPHDAAEDPPVVYVPPVNRCTGI